MLWTKHSHEAEFLGDPQGLHPGTSGFAVWRTTPQTAPKSLPSFHRLFISFYATERGSCHENDSDIWAVGAKYERESSSEGESHQAFHTLCWFCSQGDIPKQLLCVWQDSLNVTKSHLLLLFLYFAHLHRQTTQKHWVLCLCAILRCCPQAEQLREQAVSDCPTPYTQLCSLQELYVLYETRSHIIFPTGLRQIHADSCTCTPHFFFFYTKTLVKL